MPYGFEEPDDDILMRLQQILEPDRVRQIREAQAVPDTQEAIQSRARENEINQAWKQELFPERQADTWRSRTRKVLHAASERLRQPRDWGDGNEWLGAVSEGARAYSQAADDEETGQQADAKTKLAALISGAQVASRDEKQRLAEENMYLKYGNLGRLADLKEQDVRSKIAHRESLRKAAIDKADQDADARILRREKFELSDYNSKLAAFQAWERMVDNFAEREGLKANNLYDRFPDDASITAAKAAVAAYGERLKTHPLFRELFASGFDPNNPVPEAPAVSRGTTFGRDDRAPTGTNPDWDLQHVLENPKTKKKIVLNRRTNSWDEM
jgi:hypothetical protein